MSAMKDGLLSNGLMSSRLMSYHRPIGSGVGAASGVGGGGGGGGGGRTQAQKLTKLWKKPGAWGTPPSGSQVKK